MTLNDHSLWTLGFRPFFILAMLSGLALPLIWALMFTGRMAPPVANFSMVQWHAHEMFFGFGWALLGGFLLTASRSWLSVRGYHGPALAFLAAAWIFERIGMGFGGAWPDWLFLLSNNLFLGAIVAMLSWALIRHRKTDSYRDNYFFLLILPAFLLAKSFMLSPEHFALGTGMALALFRVAFLVMLERTVTAFMKSAFQANILRHARLDGAIKLLALVLVAAGTLPTGLMIVLETALAALLLGRFFYWHPRLALSRIDIGIMYLGYLGIVAQLLVDALDRSGHGAWVGALPVHLFTFGVMGLIIPAMMVRISKGHTGRQVMFDRGDKLCLWIMIAGLALRVAAPQFNAAFYPGWVMLAAACWCTCFSILGWRYVPFLVRPRVDGRPH
ncbi:NnrS family protein [Denitratisoma oestradiolicum]|uniref:NnrS n=1 Tax=Denitratisoma oestradiolicum TaxID=311182 RepID=A0A6S6XTL3_9PROT|nr:NnrS family protein [Denitratisoma oestradiolicum]TWO80249.1 NnrS [Denitratisoma oestradiolicum]CAB1369340.1 NnrS [Denitratisoma oestradiolicum]